jgi:hypothetical protein
MSLPTETTQSSSPPATLNLHLDVEEVRQELALPDPDRIGIGSDVDPELDQRAREIAVKLVDWEPGDAQGQDQARAAVETMGRALQRDAARLPTRWSTSS